MALDDQSKKILLLWHALDEVQAKLVNVVIPLLEHLQADPDGNLLATLTLAEEGIRKHVHEHRLQAVQKLVEK